MIYIDITGAMSPVEKPGYYPVFEGQKPTPTPCTEVIQDKLQWEGDHWIQLYKLQNSPLYSAGEWLEMVGLGANQQPTLIYLRLKLNMVGKQSKKLDDLENYLNQVLTEFATNNFPKCDWGLPPVSYYETVKEVMEILNS